MTIENINLTKKGTFSNEYEVKLLGRQSSLIHILRNFIDTTEPKRDRAYSFNTYYLDCKDAFRDAGYSFRHRMGTLEANYPPGSEVKALEGTTGKGLVSKRAEMAFNGENPLTNYFDMVRSPIYPTGAPSNLSPRDLEITFVSAQNRIEVSRRVDLGDRVVTVEAALDNVTYLANEGGGSKGYSWLDTLLLPVKQEPELEFELKTCQDDSTAEMFCEWLKETCVKKTPFVRHTTTSKATRGFSYCCK